GGCAHHLLHAAYTIAFIHLLQFDKVLKIQVHDTIFHERGMVLNMLFCKTHQNGDIKPYCLWALPQPEAHLCPTRAIADWIFTSSITSGFVSYIFQKITSGDHVMEGNVPMSSEQFLELFHNNILNVNEC
ncbi:hypothetical protein PAXRUDRAFT_173006, partial [Paxillus rubicundulus Ve08.2h10]